MNLVFNFIRSRLIFFITIMIGAEICYSANLPDKNDQMSAGKKDSTQEISLIQKNYSQHCLWDDFKTSLLWSYNGFKNQFIDQDNIKKLMIAGPALYLSFNRDEYISQKWGKNKKSIYFDALDAIGVITNTPLLALGLYGLGRNFKDEKFISFSMEFFSLWTLTTVETIGLSFLPIHERPSSDNLSSWETGFRGDSSFPSGHVLPLMALSFKSYQFYGLKAAVLPITLTTLLSYERIQARKHYLSDILGSFFLTYFANNSIGPNANDKESSKVSIYPRFFHDFYAMNLNFVF